MEYMDPEYDFNYIDYLEAEEPEMGYDLNRDLNMAHRIVEETAVNLFLTGKAGTGKTTFLHRLREHSPKRMVVLAPTGVAAINAHGATIHSFFQLPFSPFIPGKGFIGEPNRMFRFSKEKRRIIASIDLLVIDEVSMVRPDTLDAIDSVLRRFRNPTLPFGGVQLLLIGDLRQLAPVLRDNERELLSPYYPSEYFFESVALKQSGFVTIELSTIYRQNDPEFVRILNSVRDGVLTQDVIRRLNSRYVADFNPPDSEKYIRLTTHNRLADDINQSRLDHIPEAGVTFHASVKGKFPEYSYPAEKALTLKTGAQVMFIKNDSGSERKYYNGLIGTVSHIGKNNVSVIPVDGGLPISVSAVEWENTGYAIDETTKEIMPIVEGTFTQLPLRLAWAITIHKSQGLTFDRAIIDAGYSFAPGQTYVALSRCRSLEGLVLSRPIPMQAVIIDQKVNEFIDRASSGRPDDSAINEMRAEYTRHTLGELFDFRPLRIAFDEFYRYVKEYVFPQYADYADPFIKASDKLKHDIDLVGAKFKTLYASQPILPEDFEKHPEFLDKIKSGCRYFVGQLEDVRRVVESVKVNLTNAAHVTRLSNSYETLSFRLNTKLGLLRRLSGVTFTSKEYIDAKVRAVLEVSGDSASVSPFKKQSGRKRRSKKEK